MTLLQEETQALEKHVQVKTTLKAPLWVISVHPSQASQDESNAPGLPLHSLASHDLSRVFPALEKAPFTSKDRITVNDCQELQKVHMAVVMQV